VSRVQFRRTRATARVALVTALSIAWSPVAPLLRAQAATSKPAAAKPAATSAPASQVPPDGGWPRAYTTNAGAALVIYQPQVSAWADQRHVVLYSAVSYTAKGATKPAFGTLKIESDTRVAMDQRLVSFSDFKITESTFSTLKKEQVQDILAEIAESMPLDERVIALDRVLANVDASRIVPKNAEGIKADPPIVFFSKTPAVLVNLDGDPIWSPIKDNDLKFAVNTNWDLFQHTPTNTYYLLATDTWLKATDIKGPWTYAGPLPASFSKLPADDNYKEVKAALPGKKVSPEKTPKVFVTLVPGEMILLTGEPKYVPVAGAGSLLWVSNTTADVFRMGPAGPVYYLVAGRWFSAPDFTGPWTFATPSMPEEFKKIPLEHDRSRVLASVPGTQQAAEAVLLAQIPQTARVSKKTPAPEVAYDGTPQFQPVEKTQVSRAVNTDKDILKVGDLYYMCFQGVWFMSKSPTGPWEVTGEVPKAIYEIPPSSPSYNVTYVTVQESNDDAVVLATAIAFTGVMIAWGCAVHGTGYYYPPYMHYGAYPVYYPHYPTYGYGASYNPWTGTYGRSAVAYGPYGGAGVSAKYNPRTGTYGRSAAAYGPYGSAKVGQAYNPRTGAYGQTRQGSNVYGNWGSTTVARGDDWAQTAHSTNNRTGTTKAAARTSEGGAAVARSGPGGSSAVAKSGSGDVYAGHDGNVYKKDGDSYQKYENGSWNDVQAPTQDQKNQAKSQAQSQAQARGAQSGTQTAGTQARTGTASTQAAGTARSTASRSSWSGDTASQVQRDASARSTGTARTNAYSGGTTKSSSYGTGSRTSGASRSGGGGRRR
jgi:hypothetical protein